MTFIVLAGTDIVEDDSFCHEAEERSWDLFSHSGFDIFCIVSLFLWGWGDPPWCYLTLRYLTTHTYVLHDAY